MRLEDLKVQIFADGADLDAIRSLRRNPLIKGFTTNPTLMRKAGVEDYASFAAELLSEVDDLPVSFEVFADELSEMEWQAREIASWASNVNVKIPVTNTRREPTLPIIRRLSSDGIPLNVTAVMTHAQVASVTQALDPAAPAIVSVFAGRIADTGRDPVPVMAECVEILKPRPMAQLLWASPRELLNIFHADTVGCHIITVTDDLLAKLPSVGKELNDFSLETVRMFYEDAKRVGYEIQDRRADRIRAVG